LKLAKIALDAGADGIVCSPLEVEVLREVYGEDFVIVRSP
jgi:orotidine-5'-phosphate decarboxylase